MAEETEATLRDTVVIDPAQAEDTPIAVADAPVLTDVPDTQAAEIGRLLLDSGYTKDQLNDLLAAPQALAAMRNAVVNDPQEFLRMIERSNPDVADKFLDKVTDLYVERNGDKGKTGKPSGDSSDLMREVAALRAETNELKTREQQREHNLALASTTQRYNARVDDLLNLKEVKDLDLLPSEIKNLKARLNVELGQDQNVVQRVAKGNFVDVPQTFKGIIEEVAGDRKAKQAAETAKRERAANGGYSEFQSGPNPLTMDIPKGTFDSWDNTEDGFAKALTGTR